MLRRPPAFLRLESHLRIRRSMPNYRACSAALPHLVFLYGGDPCNLALTGNTLIISPAITANRFHLEGQGAGFPRAYTSALPNPTGAKPGFLRGRLHAVTSDGLEKLDKLFDNRRAFERVETTLIGHTTPAWMYLCLLDLGSGDSIRPRLDGTVSWRRPAKPRSFTFSPEYALARRRVD